MRKKLIVILLLALSVSVTSQVTQLYTGTTVTLNHLSCIGNTILVGGSAGNFLAESVNEGNTLSILLCPGASTNYSFLQRTDKDTVYLMSIGNDAELYRSNDGAKTWQKRMDTTIFVPNTFIFFNGGEGIVDYGYGNKLLRTLNGGATWTETITPLDNPTVFQSYGDSSIIAGGIGTNGVGYFRLSKDRGHTWPTVAGLGGQGGGPRSFYFLNSDTIMGISSPDIFGKSHFTKSIDGGQSWQNSVSPLYHSLGLTKKGENIYLIGATAGDDGGIIAKSSDLGKTWSTFHTGISTRLISMTFLNDSIALLSGTNGVLIRWNYNMSVFTSVPSLGYSDLSVRVYPNPFNNLLLIECSRFEKKQCSILNALGEIVLETEFTVPKMEFNLENLKSGIYLVKVNCAGLLYYCKILKN